MARFILPTLIFTRVRGRVILRSSPIRLCEVHTIPIDSLRVFSEKAAIVCLFGARRLSQQAYASFPEPRKGAYPYVRRYRTKSVDYFGTLRRAQTTRQPYSPKCVEGDFLELRKGEVLRSSRRVLTAGTISTGAKRPPTPSTSGRKERTMQLEGITWHALALQAHEFGPTKKLLIEVFGLRPAIDTDGYTRFPMPTAPSSSSTHQKPSLPTASTTVAWCSASGWRTSKRPQRDLRRPDASFWGRSHASSRRTTPIATSGAPTVASTGSTSRRSRSGSRSSSTVRQAFGVGWSWSPAPSEPGYAELRHNGVLRSL